ncbi:unnamed protein product [Hydatigera taeniaeformis]|uniref:CNDH2_C domain-containing protein n=1 Tax=Hydatigena taeniaeformis TaxID=6205 RepID=A0A158REI4_HYDTA|nr:unnamed protein product [Hydatigera taeniaeformis]
MQQRDLTSDTFSVEPFIEIEKGGPLILGPSTENVVGTKGVTVEAAAFGAEKRLNQEVLPASPNGGGDGKENIAKVYEKFVPFVLEGICNQEAEDASENVGEREAARHSRQISTLKKSSVLYDREKFAIHSTSQRLVREAEVHLPAYKPKQYSTFAEFRKALKGDKSQPTPTLRAFSTRMVNKGRHVLPALNSDAGCPADGLTSATRPDSNEVPTNDVLKLPAELLPPRLPKANDDDIIDLLEDENSGTSAKHAHLNRLLSRFIGYVKTTDWDAKADAKRAVEYSIITKASLLIYNTSTDLQANIPDARTGRFSLQLDKVAYKPSHSKAITFTDRRTWAKHRLELQAIMRSKRLRHYDERMQRYGGPRFSSATSDNDPDEVEGDESEISTETEQEEDEDVAGDEDSDEIINMSHIRNRANLFVDDEAEEDEDGDDDGIPREDAAGICKSPSNFSSEAVKAHQALASGGCVEPGEIDLFSNDTTHLVDSMSVVFTHLESLEDHYDPKMFPSMNYENPLYCELPSAKILNRPWDGTPYGMLFSQQRIPLQDSASVYSSIENNNSDETLSILPSSQPQICQDLTQPSFSEDISSCDPDPASLKFPLHMNPLVETEGKPKLMRVRDTHESGVSSATSQVSVCALGFSQSPQDISSISLFSNYDSQPRFLSDAQTTQVNTKLLGNTDAEFSAEPVDTRSVLSTDTQHLGDDQQLRLPPESRRRLKRLSHTSGGNSGDEADFERVYKRRAFFSEQTQCIKGPEEKLPDESQIIKARLVDTAGVLTAAEDESGEAEVGDHYDLSDVENATEGTEYSSDNEMKYLCISEREKNGPKYKPTDFIDEEAELSGDDAERAIYLDEEEDIDDDSDLHSLKDFVDENEIDDRTGKLRCEVERVYNRIQNDDDRRRIRFLKEMFFEDGDLYEEGGRVRQRRFRWRGLDKEDPLTTNGTDSDEDGEENEEEGRPEGEDVFSASVCKGAGIMSRWLLQGSSGSLSGKVSAAGDVNSGSKDTEVPESLVTSTDGASNMKYGASSESIYGSILSRSTALLPNALVGPSPHTHDDDGVEIVDPSVSSADDACASGATWTNRFGSGLSGMPGEIFIRLLKLIIVPLIVATVIMVTSTLDLKENGKISAVSLAFITTSNTVAAICGTVASLLLKPGYLTPTNASIINQTFTTDTPPKTSDIFADMLYFTPVGVCFMIAGPIAGLRELSTTFGQLGLFMVTVIAALIAHMIIIFTIYAAFTRSNPFRLLPHCFRTWLISIATLAPVVTIPDMYNASDAFGINPKVSRFVVPLTATLKGDGSAAFLGASAVFIVQLTNTPLTSAMVVIIILLSAAAVFTLPNIPSSSLVILVTILASLGVPVNYVGLLFAIDWFMDRCRTTNLAVLHLYCVAFTHLICEGKLHRNKDSNDVNGLMPIPMEGTGLEDGAFISF